MAASMQAGLQDWGWVTALLAAQLAVAPGLRERAARASMYAVANVSPAPFVSTAVTCIMPDHRVDLSPQTSACSREMRPWGSSRAHTHGPDPGTALRKHRKGV